MASQQRSTHFMGLLGFLLVALLAVFASADETAASAYKRQTSPVAALDDCSSTTCSGCKGFCSWCGNSDTEGYCTACESGGACAKPASCTYKYWTRSLCPSEMDAIALGAGAVIGIVVASIVGCCCFVAAGCLLVYCCCFAGAVAIGRRSPGHQGYVVHQNPSNELAVLGQHKAERAGVVFDKGVV